MSDQSPGEDEALPPGTTVGEYAIEGLLGRGGMGEVYGAHHPVIGKRVAIKVMNRACSGNPINVERFVHEAKAVNAIGHSNIVDIFSFGRTTDGRSYFVMELLQGESLRAALGRGPIEATRAYEILDEVLRALEAAHAAGIVHRDLKPDNIFLVKNRDDRDRVKLLDFGIAKLAAERAGAPSSMTQTGTVVGTPTHMSPEQATGNPVGAASDIYALGVVAFELATGTLPFSAPSSVQLMAKHCDEAPPLPSSIRPVDRAFEHLILDMLAKGPADRPSASAVRQRLARLRDASTASAVTDPQRTQPAARSVVAKQVQPAATAPTEVLPATGPSAPVDSVATPAQQTPVPTSGERPAARSRSRWPLIGGAAVIATGAIIVFALRGGDDAPPSAEQNAVEQPVAPQTAEPSPAPAAHSSPPATPTPPAPEPAPEPAPSTAKADEPAPAAPVGRRRKQPPVRRPAAPVAEPSPPKVEAPAPQAPPPAPPTPQRKPDVDAVHDPFADAGGKK